MMMMMNDDDDPLGIIKCELLHSFGWVGGSRVPGILLGSFLMDWFVDFVWEKMKSMGFGGSCSDVVGPLIIKRRT